MERAAPRRVDGTLWRPALYHPFDPGSLLRDDRMTCCEFVRRYSDYDDSLLSAEENAAFRAHIAVCASCARYDRVLRKGRMLARQLPPPEPSRDFFPSLHGRLADARRRRTQARVGVTGMLAAATVVLAAVGGLGLMRDEGIARAALLAGRAKTSDAVARGGGAVPGSWEPLPSRGGEAVGVAAGHGVVAAAGLRVAAVPSAPPRQWMAVRVDRAVRASYSPLVTGPPQYRAPPAGHAAGAAASTARAID